MATNPLSSAELLANPTLDADPGRYSVDDGTNPNRVVSWFRYFVPWTRIRGSIWAVRGHKPTSAGRDAGFYDNVDTVTAIAAETPYVIADPGEGPTADIELKQISSRHDLRDFAAALLSDDFDQADFQRGAIGHAIWTQWERAVAVGDSSASAEFDGLGRLVARGLGQQFAASSADPLGDLDDAICRIHAHSRRVDVLVMNCDAWRKLISLQRNRGFRPPFIRHERSGQMITRYNGIPVCINDHIPTVSEKTSVYVMTLGRPNGVHALLPRRHPEIRFKRCQRDDDPFEAWQGSLYSAITCGTSDALVELTDFSTTPDSGGGGAPVCHEVASTSSTGTNATYYVPLSGMKFTLPAGSYYISFSCYASNLSAQTSVRVMLFLDGVAVSHTERRLIMDDSGTDYPGVLALNACVTVDGSEELEICWRSGSSFGTACCFARTLDAVKVEIAP